MAASAPLSVAPAKPPAPQAASAAQTPSSLTAIAPAAGGPASAAPDQVASASAAKAAAGQQTRLLFSGESTELSEAAKQNLNGVIAKMQSDDELRIQLVAYASGTADQTAKARRISLSRALAARAYVLGQGVRSTRIDVRALGNASEDSPADRIDVVLTK